MCRNLFTIVLTTGIISATAPASAASHPSAADLKPAELQALQPTDLVERHKVSTLYLTAPAQLAAPNPTTTPGVQADSDWKYLATLLTTLVLTGATTVQLLHSRKALSMIGLSRSGVSADVAFHRANMPNNFWLSALPPAFLAVGTRIQIELEQLGRAYLIAPCMLAVRVIFRPQLLGVQTTATVIRFFPGLSSLLSRSSPAIQRLSILWFVAQLEVSMAPHAFASGQRLKAVQWLIKGRHAASGLRWWLTVAGLFLPQKWSKLGALAGTPSHSHHRYRSDRTGHLNET